MRTFEELRTALAPRLSEARARIAASPPAEATIVCIPRHGWATTRATVESVYRRTDRRFRLVCVDVAAPPGVRAWLARQAAERPDFWHLRIDELVSRQTARLLGMELVATEHVVFLDNNMLLSPGWLGRLLDVAAETGAALVSPLLVTLGGEIHFSAGTVRRRLRGGVVRPHFQKGGPVGMPVGEARLRRVDIDFAESHCCAAETAAMRIPGVLREELHNAQTLCYAAYRLGRAHRRRAVLDPGAVASIVPISFGYDLDWILRSYMEPDRIAGSYAALVELMGRGPSTDLEPALAWHRKHLKYLLATMAVDDRLRREDLLAPDELPERVRGYDRPLAADTDQRIAAHVVPHVAKNRGELLPLLEPWLR